MKGTREVIVVKTGVANTASVLAGLSRVGAQASLSDKASDILSASHVVLPGVGSFEAGMAQLREKGLEQALVQRVHTGQAFLGICLGMQLLCEESEESPGVCGLGVVPGRLRRFSSNVRCPQLGWNEIVPEDNSLILSRGYAYFANSFRLLEPPPGWHTAETEYDGPFIAALERGAVIACQFHPELSSTWGLGLLKRWLSLGDSE